MNNKSELKYKLIGILDDKVSLIGRRFFNIPILGEIDTFKDIIKIHDISLVLFTVDHESKGLIKEYCEKNSIGFKVVSLNI